MYLVAFSSFWSTSLFFSRQNLKCVEASQAHSVFEPLAQQSSGVDRDVASNVQREEGGGFR